MSILYCFCPVLDVDSSVEERSAETCSADAVSGLGESDGRCDCREVQLQLVHSAVELRCDDSMINISHNYRSSCDLRLATLLVST